ncbi:MAG TPA: leucyl/phenylalanyl-tRNA--protein transferase [Devosia sp.]
MFSFRYPPRSLAELRNDFVRVGLGIAYSLKPKRLSALPYIVVAGLQSLVGLGRDQAFDTPLPLPASRRGFLGMAPSLDPESLMHGFRLGYFPFSHVGPKKWFMHAQRMVIEPHLIKRDKDVKRLLRSGKLRVTFDQRFEEVMRACAEPRKGQVPLTWITEDIIAAYVKLHETGDAHSFEAWNEEGELVGGGFGIAVGPVFVIESQFTKQRNASKVAMVTLLRHLSAWGFAFADGKTHTDYLEAVGFAEIPHDDYVAVIRRGPDRLGPTGLWNVDPALDASGDWQPAAQTAAA